MSLLDGADDHSSQRPGDSGHIGQQAAGEPGDDNRRADRSGEDGYLPNDCGGRRDRGAATDQSGREVSQTATLLQPVYRPSVPHSNSRPSGLQAWIAARCLRARASARSRAASMIRNITKVVQLGSSSAAASQTENPMQVTKSGPVN